MKTFKEYLAESEAHNGVKPKRFQFQPGPNPKEFGEPENKWNPPGTQPAFNQQYMDWRDSEQGKAHAAANTAHWKQQLAAHKQHKAQHGKFDTTIDEFPNPFFDPNGTDDENDPNYQPEFIDIGVDYSYTEEPYIPARIRYDDYDHPEEGGEIEIDVKRVIDLDTGEDITKSIDGEELDRRLTDEIVGQQESVSSESDVMLESIKRLSGLK
jgi:hypothetical protein